MLEYKPWKPLTGQQYKQKLLLSNITLNTMLPTIIVISKMNVAIGRVVKKPVVNVVARNKKFISHMFFNGFGHFLLSPKSLLFTLMKPSLCIHSPNAGRGHVVHHNLEKNGTSMSISITHHNIHTNIIAKL